jgi:hypothetical protein
VFVMTRSWLQHDVPVRFAIALVSSAGTTALIAAAGIRALARWPTVDRQTRLIVLFAGVLAGNAVLSYAYTKDDIMSVAGVFYALAAYAAVRALLVSPGVRGRVVSAVLAVCLMAVGAGWTVRSLGLHHITRSAAFKTRNDWAFQPARWKAEGRWPSDPSDVRVIMALRDEALAARVPNPRFEPAWAYAVWGD